MESARENVIRSQELIRQSQLLIARLKKQRAEAKSKLQRIAGI